MEASGAGVMMAALWDFIHPHAGIGEYVFFDMISDYLDHEIARITSEMVMRSTNLVIMFALVVMTLWVTAIGYQMVSGTFRGSMMSLVTDIGKKVLIIATAATMALLGTDLHSFMDNSVDSTINELVTGEKVPTSEAIDKNLAYMQIAFTAIDAIEVTDGNQELRDEKARALMFAGFGTSSPALTAGAMLIFFKFINMFFIGLGPIFILSLFFQSTKDMFRRWLQFGIATIFAQAGLSLVTSIVLKLSMKVAFAFWGAKVVNGILGADPEGITSQAMQQGGVGLLLTVTIISVPSVLAAFFGGLAGSGFMHASAFGGGGAARGAQPQPSMPQPTAAPPANSAVSQQVNAPNTLPGLQGKAPPVDSSPANTDSVKSASDLSRKI